MQIDLPKKVKYIIDKIYEYGYEAFIVGGCVRDHILGIIPHDYDITTSAKPEIIMEIFKEYKFITNGIKHGTVGVIIDKDIYEITTYRLEGEYEDNRRPKNIEFTLDIESDLKRRDFTINSMAYNDNVGIIDKFDGIKDLNERIIRTVGNPDDRFKEDGLRIIRAVRFSAKLGFNIEEKTLNSIYKNSNIVKNISIERVTDEISKIIISNNPQKLVLLYKTGIFKYLDIICDFNETEYLQLENYLEIVNNLDENIEDRLIILQYIINNIKNIKGYNNLLEENYIVNKLSYSNKLKENINIAIKYMFMNEDNLDKVEIKYILNKIEYNNFIKILKLKKFYYDYILQKSSNDINEVINNIKHIINNKECYKISKLEIGGQDLKELGYKGIEIGEKLNYVLDKVIKNPDLNKKDILIKIVNFKSK